MQARGQTQSVTLPVTVSKTWTGARTQSHGAAWESMRGEVWWGGGVSLWVAGAFRSLFTSCLVPHHHHFEGGGGFAEGVIMQDGGQVFGYGWVVFRSFVVVWWLIDLKM